MKKILFIALIIATFVAGCSELGLPQETPGPQETITPTLQTTEPASPAERSTATAERPSTLHIWLPPEFDPQADTPAGKLLQERLDEFASRRTGLSVEIRIKAVDGSGGLLDSLTTASAAAPLALPDLVALPASLLETASLKGLIHPFDGFIETMDDPDWYDYARQLARLQNSTFGLPFAGDAMVLVYRPAAVESPPVNWAQSLEANHELVFAAADPQALFTLAQYQAAGGDIQDEQGRPFLEMDPLVEVLTFYQSAETGGVMPFWLTQYQSDEQAWQYFVENNSDMVVTWTSRFLGAMLADTAMASIPTPEGVPYTLSSGWVWVLAAPQAERQQLGAELAEFLTDSNFMARWTQAAGYLPPRPSALNAWSSTSLQSTLEDIILSAKSYPPTDVLISIGPPLQQASIDVLKEQVEPTQAAQTAVESVSAP
jgi:multiple sugar transport system substrate-binding protein